MFVDEVRVTLRAGNGGNGCVSFRREKFIPKGGPNGGDGGNGGDIVIACDENVGDLTEYRYTGIVTAQHGEHGKGSDQHGRKGEDRRVRVPPGTVVISEETGETVTEVTYHGEEVVLLRGGNGGWGNLRFKNSVNQAPRRANPGQPGEEGVYRLVLKTIAEVGLVGYPNAGKSTLTTMLTNARPQAAPYPFTTLNPHVGVIDYADAYERVLLADIPGLIEGAHENRGLGHQFLRHIERCELLLYLLDMSGIDGRDPLDDYAQLRREVALYSEACAAKPWFVVGNKMDEPDAAEHLKRFRERYPEIDILPLSCLSDEGMPELRREILKRVSKLRKSEGS